MNKNSNVYKNKFPSKTLRYNTKQALKVVTYKGNLVK